MERYFPRDLELFCLLPLLHTYAAWGLHQGGLAQERINMWASRDATERCFVDLQGNFKGRVSCSSTFKKKRCDSWWCDTKNDFFLSTNSSSNSVANKGLPTTACTMQKEDLSIVVVDRLHYSIVYLSLCIVELSHVGYDSVGEFSYVVIVTAHVGISMVDASAKLWGAEARYQTARVRSKQLSILSINWITLPRVRSKQLRSAIFGLWVWYV